MRENGVNFDLEFIVEHAQGVLVIRCHAALIVATIPFEGEVAADAGVVALDQAHTGAVFTLHLEGQVHRLEHLVAERDLVLHTVAIGRDVVEVFHQVGDRRRVAPGDAAHRGSGVAGAVVHRQADEEGAIARWHPGGEVGAKLLLGAGHCDGVPIVRCLRACVVELVAGEVDVGGRAAQQNAAHARVAQWLQIGDQVLQRLVGKELHTATRHVAGALHVAGVSVRVEKEATATGREVRDRHALVVRVDFGQPPFREQITRRAGIDLNRLVRIAVVAAGQIARRLVQHGSVVRCPPQRRLAAHHARVDRHRRQRAFADVGAIEGLVVRAVEHGNIGSCKLATVPAVRPRVEAERKLVASAGPFNA